MGSARPVGLHNVAQCGPLLQHMFLQFAQMDDACCAGSSLSDAPAASAATQWCAAAPILCSSLLKALHGGAFLHLLVCWDVLAWVGTSLLPAQQSPNSQHTILAQKKHSIAML